MSSVSKSVAAIQEVLLLAGHATETCFECNPECQIKQIHCRRLHRDNSVLTHTHQKYAIWLLEAVRSTTSTEPTGGWYGRQLMWSMKTCILPKRAEKTYRHARTHLTIAVGQAVVATPFVVMWVLRLKRGCGLTAQPRGPGWDTKEQRSSLCSSLRRRTAAKPPITEISVVNHVETPNLDAICPTVSSWALRKYPIWPRHGGGGFLRLKLRMTSANTEHADKS